ncbi:hypothetical protein EUTSA_v10015188mg [Eutrema salsugineum]|uniref:Uncharacterized protein n=1 Tax=Eutrema salsugineum TaxID=72664 RepID=V4LCU8_EUTSA|nr:hypothetical protein EUTSA_v10015188mg [Eutrema salsugineum]
MGKSTVQDPSFSPYSSARDSFSSLPVVEFAKYRDEYTVSSSYSLSSTIPSSQFLLLCFITYSVSEIDFLPKWRL